MQVTAPRTTVDLGDVRVAAGLMLGAAAVLPLVPGEPGVPCPLRLVTGVPCPLCGLTTSVTAAVHLDLAGAVVSSPGGPVLVVLAVAALVSRRHEATMPSWVLPLALAALWAWQLARVAAA